MRPASSLRMLGFLEPKPLSFYDPTTTFTTEAGLQATMAAADKQLRDIWINGESNALALEYRLSELAANGKTDESNPFVTSTVR